MESEDKVAPKRDPLEVLKGFGGILPGKVIYATPPVYKEVYPNQPDKWPVYKIKPSDGLDFNNDVDNQEIYQFIDGRAVSIPGKLRIHKIKRCLKGWKNHRDGDIEIPFPADAHGDITDEGIKALKPDLQNWLLSIISDSDAISKEESEGLKF
jgi:hypothetical protein